MSLEQDLGFFATDISLEGKSAIVTGSSRGIGRAIATELARQGTDVLVNYNNNREAAEEVKDEIERTWSKSGYRASGCQRPCTTSAIA